jgi:hypothetical protein
MRNGSAVVIWPLALLTSALGAALIFDSEPGINWPIWVAAASLSVLAARLASVKRVEVPLAILLGWATLLSLRFALRTSDLNAFVVLSDAMLLGLAVITIGAPAWGQLSAKLLAVVPILAPFRVWRATAQQVADTPRSVHSPRSRSLIRGALLSAPLVILLFVLLGNADPVIRWATDHIAGWLPDWSFPPRMFFFLFLLSLTLGANAIAARQLEPALPNLPRFRTTAFIGVTEQRMVLWSAAVVLWLFVLLQLSYLIQPPPAAINSGVTFAEFARKGFGELSIAVTIVGAIILVLEYARPVDISERDRKLLTRLELALVLALELILLSAFRRVVLYEQAFGFTTDRVFAQTYMLVMALALLALAFEIVRGSISVNFARRVAVIALGAFTVLAFWNHEAWIVDKNIDRGIQTGKFDLAYARRLSDAVPTLINRRRELGPVAADIEAAVRCEKGLRTRRWFEWNRGANELDEALRSVHPAACPSGESLRWIHRADRSSETTTPASAASAGTPAS